jgi:hypothetical protein
MNRKTICTLTIRSTAVLLIGAALKGKSHVIRKLVNRSGLLLRGCINQEEETHTLHSALTWFRVL